MAAAVIRIVVAVPPPARLVLLGLMLASLGLAACQARPTPAAPRRTIVLVGESTTWGAIGQPGRPTRTDPGTALRALLGVVDRTCPYYRARVQNFAIPATPTPDWVRTFNPVWCYLVGHGYKFEPMLRVACARRLPFAAAIAPALGRLPDLVLVNAMGTNDPQVGLTPEETVANVAALAGVVGVPPPAILVAPPFPRSDKPERAAYVAAVRQLELDRGLLTGPDWLHFPLYDGVHLTAGGYAAAAGFWLDFLCPERGSQAARVGR